MGDFNSVSDMSMDKSGNSSYHSEIPKGWKECLRNQILVDIWRERNKSRKDYTYFSGCHNSFSRLDYVYQRQEADFKINSIKIGLRTHSDHAPVVITWQVIEES